MLTSIVRTLLILILIFSTIVFAGSPTIFEGSKVLLLKQNIDLNRQFSILSGGLNPSITAVAANPGSLYMSSNTNLYKKNDAGLTTNWSPFGVAPTVTAWATQGNAGTNPATDFVGTTDNNDFILKSNNVERLRLRATGELDTTLTAGVVHSNAQGILSSSLVDFAFDVTGVNTVSHGGTGQASLTSGALIVGNGTNPVNTLSPGANGDCAQVVGGVWVSAACPSSGGGGGGFGGETWVNISSPTQLGITTNVTNYAVDMTTGVYPITLPAVAGKNAPICFKKIDSTGNPISVTASSGETVDGDPQLYINTQNAVNCIKTNGVTNYVF